MRKYISIALVGLVAVLVVSAALAGIGYWPGIGDSGVGETIWTDAPTPASFWQRDTDQNVYTIGYAYAFDDTIRMITTTNLPITVHAYDTGFWELDANGDTSVKLLTGYAAHRLEKWSRKDAQWGMDVNGDIFPMK